MKKIKLSEILRSLKAKGLHKTAKNVEIIVSQKVIHARKIAKIRFRVWPKDKKVRYYSDLNQVTKDFNSGELEGAHISIILNSTVVGDLDTERVLDELF